MALPDSNTGNVGDSVYTFRLRSDSLPLFSSSPLDHTYLFGYCFFRQQRDPALPRGFFQKAVVIVTDLPYVGLFKKIVHVLGPLYFEAGHAALEAAFNNFHAWCEGPLVPLCLALP